MKNIPKFYEELSEDNKVILMKIVELFNQAIDLDMQLKGCQIQDEYEGYEMWLSEVLGNLYLKIDGQPYYENSSDNSLDKLGVK